MIFICLRNETTVLNNYLTIIFIYIYIYIYILHTCWDDMKYTSVLLLASRITCPTEHCTVIHFCNWSINKNTLTMTCRILVPCLRYIHHFFRIVKCPTETIWRWVCLYAACYSCIFVTSYAINSFLIR